MTLSYSCYLVAHLPTVVDMDAKEIVYNDFVDINVAVASERGFVFCFADQCV